METPTANTFTATSTNTNCKPVSQPPSGQSWEPAPPIACVLALASASYGVRGFVTVTSSMAKFAGRRDIASAVDCVDGGLDAWSVWLRIWPLLGPHRGDITYSVGKSDLPV